jgi:hypothetical protein
MKRRWLIPMAWILVIFGTIGATQAAGWWSAGGREEVVAASLTADDVKGWMTIQQAADGLGIPVGVIVEAIADPTGTIQPTTAFKDVEAVVPDFSLDDFREVIRALLARSPAPAISPTPAPTPQPTHTATSTNSVTGQQTLRQVAADNGLDLATLIAESGLPPDVNSDVPLRTLRDTIAGFEMLQVRDAVDRLK